MTVTFTRPITAQSRFGKELLAAGQRKITAGLNEVGRDAVRRVNANVEKLYDNTRDGLRSKGDVKLLGSFDFRVVKPASPGQPAQLIITSSADPSKVGALEHGSPAHEITPREADWLVFDRNPRNVFQQRLDKKLGPAKGLRQRRAASAPHSAGKGNLTRAKSVSHPGNREGRFMRGGLEGAIRAAYRRVTVTD